MTTADLLVPSSKNKTTISKKGEGRHMGTPKFVHVSKDITVRVLGGSPKWKDTVRDEIDERDI